MNKTVYEQLPVNNTAIRPSAFSVPSGELLEPKFRLTVAHVVLAVMVLLSVLVVAFISVARSVDVIAIEQTLSKKGEHQVVRADVSFASIIKLPLGNRVLILPGEHQVEVLAQGYQAISKTLTVGDDANQSFELELVRLPGQLDIRLESSKGERLADGASLLIDGLVRGAVPALIQDITAGQHLLEVDAPLYRALSHSVLVHGKNQTQTLALTLEPAWAEYRLSSRPEGAEVFVDGELKGATPLTFKVEEGRHDLRIQADKFKSFKQMISVVAEQNLVIPTVNLIPAHGSLTLDSTPSGAAVILNKEYRGSTPITLALTPDTRHSIKLYKAGYHLESRHVSLAAAGELSETVALNSDVIPVKISVSPRDAVVYVDGKARAKGTQIVSLNTLPHSISVRKPGFVTQTVDIIPTRANKQIVSVNLLTNEQHYWAQVPNQYRNRFGHEMLLFKELGEVSMGSSRRENGRRANEVAYTAKLTKAFYVATTETTNKQYRAYRASHSSGNYKEKSLDAQNAPVVNISWQNAAQYCNWLSEKEGLDSFYQTTKGFISGHNPDANGYRLLSEVEWAWLARNKGGDVLLYPWGRADAPSTKVGNYADTKASTILTFILENYDDGYKGPSPVGRFKKNHRGLYDLDGNVSEWMHDWYTAKGNSELQGQSPLTDPLGPDIGEFHVVRGASWAKGYLPQLRLAYRDYAAKGKHDIGFRVARYAGLNKDER